MIHSEYIFIGTLETLRGNSSLGISHNRHTYINRAHISHLTISTQRKRERERERETCPLSITRDFITICNRTSPKLSVNRTLHNGTGTINLSSWWFLSCRTDCRNCSFVKTKADFFSRLESREGRRKKGGKEEGRERERREGRRFNLNVAITVNHGQWHRYKYRPVSPVESIN